MQYSAAAESDSLALTFMKATEEEMLFLDSPLLEKYHGRKDLWFAVPKPVAVGIVLMKQCLVLSPEVCLSLVGSW